MEATKTRVGVLALQGGFAEHVKHLKSCATFNPSEGDEVVEVRTPEELSCVDALVIPGGESTAMALLAERWGLVEPLKALAKEKPIWGTCAGMIFLANNIHGSKEGGQTLIGGVDITVHRNFFGGQVHSFESKLKSPSCLLDIENSNTSDVFRAVFIRAPAMLLNPPPPSDVEILATVDLDEPVKLSPTSEETVEKVAVAVKQRNLLVTAFHPELTADTRWHSLFWKMVRESKPKAKVAAKSYPSPPLPLAEKYDLPVQA